MPVQKITLDGRECVILDCQDYEDLMDIRAAAIAKQGILNGAPTFANEQLDEYLAAPTPLAYWRKRFGKTQAALAAEAGISQPFLAQIETGVREGTVGVLARIAKALGLKIEDLLVEQDHSASPSSDTAA